MATSLLLEEPVLVNYRVVGTPDWLSRAIEPGAIPEGWSIPIRQPSDMDPIARYLDSHKKLAWDSESGGPKPLDGLDPLSSTSQLITYQVGTEDLVYVFDPALLTMTQHIRGVMENEAIWHIAQNTKHDFKFSLRKTGIHPVKMWCTMLAEQVLTAGKDGVSVSLLAMARKYPPHRLISKAVREDFITNWDKPLTRSQLYYGARDVTLLFPIQYAQEKLVEDLRLWAVCKDEFECIPITCEMELEGFLLDVELVQMSLPYYSMELERQKQEIFDLYNEELDKQGLRENRVLDDNWEIFDVNSPDKIVKALHRINVPIKSASAEDLEEVELPLTDLLIKLAETRKVLSTYGEKLFDRIHPDTGRYIPRFDQMGSGEDADDGSGRKKKETIATGRYSSNAQQWKRGDHAYAPVLDPAELEAVKALENRSIWDEFADLEAA